MNFKDAYDKARLENQLLRDALIKSRRELEFVKKQKVVSASGKQEAVMPADSGRESKLSFVNGPKVLWLSSGDGREIKEMAAKLGEDGLLISDSQTLIGQLLYGRPVCAPEALKSLRMRPFVLVYGNNYNGVRTKLQAFGYKEFVEFKPLRF